MNLDSLVDDRKLLDVLQRETLEFFRDNFDPNTGLTADSTAPGSPSSIAAVGFGLAVLVVAVQRGWLERDEAIRRVLLTLRFFKGSAQGPEADSTGFHGFYYHFLDMKTGRRAWESELSSVDTALLLAGMLTVSGYFKGSGPEESEIRATVRELYERVEWTWMLDGGTAPRHGWKPESGFLPYRWDTEYSEAMILYMLAMGSPTHPIDAKGYREWTSTFKWRKIYDLEYIDAGPLFIHQMSHLWIDFRGIQDEYIRAKGIDYFENSRRATIAQQRYAIENPLGYTGYSENGWGFTASDGPGPITQMINGAEVEFCGYAARGIPDGPDDGTISPWAVVTSLPFAPDLVMKTVRHALTKLAVQKPDASGLDASYNATCNWTSPWRFGLNEGPLILMIDNHRDGLIWNCIRSNPCIVDGLRKAGFSGGWLTTDTNK